MNEIKKTMEERKKYLLKLKVEKTRATKNTLKGRLRISCHGNRVQYYWRKGPEDINGTYLKDKTIAHELAQKEYDAQIIRLAEKEIQAINKFKELLQWNITTGN